MTISTLLSLITRKAVLGFKPLDTPIRCAPTQLEPLQTMLLLASIGCDSFLIWIFRVHVPTILLKLKDTSSTSAKDLTGTGTLEEIL